MQPWGIEKNRVKSIAEKSRRTSARLLRTVSCNWLARQPSFSC